MRDTLPDPCSLHRDPARSWLPAVALLLAAAPFREVAAQSCTGGQIITHQRFDGLPGEKFAAAVAGAGDVDGDGLGDIIVGAPDHDVAGRVKAGAAYVYSGATGALLHTFRGLQAYDFLGQSVAGAGDVDGDGFDDLIVGAPYGDWRGVRDVGNVWIYSGATGAVIRLYRGLQAGNTLGVCVAGLGDVNGDGYSDVAMGAPRANIGGSYYVGTVLVFSGSTGTLLYRFDGSLSFEFFGCPLAAAGDVDGDGHADILLASRKASPGGVLGAGSAFVYSGRTGALLHRFDGATPEEQLGESVAGAGDVDGDGFADLILGSHLQDPTGLITLGAVQVYSGASGALLYRYVGTPETPYDDLVAGAGDVDGDGHDDFLVGSRWADPGGLEDAGSVLVYSGATGGLLLRLDGTRVKERLGLAAGVGDASGDGVDDLVVGVLSSVAADAHGYASILAFRPFLKLDRYTISATSGGRARFLLDFPDSESGERYALLGSFSGSGPWTVAGGCIPLTFDFLTWQMMHRPPGITQGSRGRLGPGGLAQVVLDAPPGALRPYAGLRSWWAAVTHDAGSTLRLSSVSLPLDILP